MCLLVNVGQTGVPGIFFLLLFCGYRRASFLEQDLVASPSVVGSVVCGVHGAGLLHAKGGAPSPGCDVPPPRPAVVGAAGRVFASIEPPHAFSQPPAREARK